MPTVALVGEFRIHGSELRCSRWGDTRSSHRYPASDTARANRTFVISRPGRRKYGSVTHRRYWCLHHLPRNWRRILASLVWTLTRTEVTW